MFHYESSRKIDPSPVIEIWSHTKPELPDLELGTSGNIRILRVLDRKLRISPDTLGILPDTPDLECYITRLGYGDCSQTLLLRVSLLLSLSTSSPSLLGPKLQILPSQSISTAKEAQIDVGNHLLQVFHLEMVSFSSFSCNGSLLKVPKLGLNGLIILGCFKRFLLGQSSSYESLY